MISDKELIELYVNQELPIKTIGRQTHTDPRTIKKQLVLLNIPIINRNGRKDATAKKKLSESLRYTWKNKDADDRHLHGYKVKLGRGKRYTNLVGIDDTIEYDVESSEYVYRSGKRVYKHRFIEQECID